jgi:hypothetical protein
MKKMESPHDEATKNPGMSVRFERKSTLQYGLFYFELVYEPKQKATGQAPVSSAGSRSSRAGCCA